jgi:protein-S-isoprenylcysteine O-methyltransferase Ste14
MSPDALIYAVHVAFWVVFGATLGLAGRGAASRSGGAASPSTGHVATAARSRTARFSRSVLVVHFLAFGAMYAGMGQAVFAGRVPAWFPGQRIAGTIVIASGSALMCWSLVYFKSWRFRARVDAGHELATGGPFALVRHPIYAGMNLLAIGTAIWIPDLLCWIATALMILGSDLRGRAEEHVLRETFGAEYERYCARTRRFIPRIY